MNSEKQLDLTTRNAQLETELAQKNRELEIEAALERVRARTMAMQKSEELAETVFILFQQFKELGENPDQATIGIVNEQEHVIEYWVTMYGNQENKVYKFSIDEPNVTGKIYNAWKQRKKSLVIDLCGKELHDFATYRESMGGARYNKDEKRRIINVAFFSKGLINVQSTEDRSEESIRLLERFAAVFEGTYTRFLDLKQAEAQAREAKIEAALEKVRSRSLAMHQTDELKEVVSVVFEKLHDLDIVMDNEAASIVIFTEGTKDLILWNAIPEQSYSKSFHIPYYDTAVITTLSEAKYSGADFFERNYTAEEKEHFWNWAVKYSDYKDIPDERKKQILESEHFACSVAFTRNSAMLVSSYNGKLLSKKEGEILKRFARVFEQAYVRFLDLQKAEEQAREAQIQLALERVRARTMSMQKSEELHEVIQLIFEQLRQLNFNIDNATFALNYLDTNDFNLWIAVAGAQYATKLDVPYFKHPVFDLFNQAKHKGGLYTDILTFEEKNSFFKHFFKYAPQVAEERKAMIFNQPGYARSTALMKNTALSISNYRAIPFSEAENNTLLRFGQVFDEIYTRFSDLKQAEDQARESQIQLGLERVRAAAMAMHNSHDVGNATALVFSELYKLGINTIRCGVCIVDDLAEQIEVWSANMSLDGKVNRGAGKLDMKAHPLWLYLLNAWRKKTPSFSFELKGKELEDYYQAIRNAPNYEAPKSLKPDVSLDAKQYCNCYIFNEGCLFTFTEAPFSPEVGQVLEKFAAVFGLTYRRYLDLQKAEAATVQAIKRASVDRIRAEIASMRTTQDLERITPVIWNELKILGVPFIRCGVFIMDDAQQLIHTFLSTPDGRAIGAFHVSYNTPGNFEKIVSNWHHKKPYIDHWQEEAFAQFADTLLKQGAIKSKQQYLKSIPRGGIHLNFLPFIQGMLYVGNVAPLAPAEIDLVQSVADAFSTAYARYEDFNRLEAAKQQVDNALTKLKATQRQLVQSEKMASLGELTAGIAHEIQNPLNFVNNFSEVSAELIEEMSAELDKGDIEEAKAIASDIKDNLEKIRHHGRRADGIVKGMLQHSRASSNVKEPTDINKLADEYLHLAYHGLRAKDKSFNAELISNLDEKLPKANVVPQDIGRAILNMINNAFYATQQKAKTAGPDYKPQVTVSTCKEDGQVMIRVKDNGNGIPEAIRDKIMQPFFTTKPTGEGTGLGLSLSYDIVVKGHGGGIVVDTKEGAFTEFTITLPLS